jgi:hypothetical protein
MTISKRFEPGGPKPSEKDQTAESDGRSPVSQLFFPSL